MKQNNLLKYIVYAGLLLGSILTLSASLESFAVYVLLVSLLYGLGKLARYVRRKHQAHTPALPSLSLEREQHYHEVGMSDEQIKFFRETMAFAKKQIKTLEKNMSAVSKLKAIDLRNDTLKAAKGMFKELVKEPQKLHQADRFLYNHLPNLVDLTNKYLEISEHEIISKTTYQTLAESADVIEEVSQLLVTDYERFVSDDLAELDVELTIAKQNLARERAKVADEALKNQE